MGETPMIEASEAHRDGYVLATTVLALVVIGALVTGGVYAAGQEDRTSTAGRFADRALDYADQGINEAMGTRTKAYYDTLPSDTFITVARDTATRNGEPVGTYTVQTRRVDTLLFLIQSTGTVLSGGRYSGAERRVGQMVRLIGLDFPNDRAMQVFGGLNVTGNAEVHGEDSYPTAWEDCESTGTQKGIVAKDSSVVSSGGSSTLTGDPPKDEDASLNDDDFFEYGHMNFEELAAMAEKRYAPGATLGDSDVEPVETADGACDTSAKRNWGAPTKNTHACHTYFPTIYAEGDMSLQSASKGQGILLVEGDLSISGGFEFFGVVIVKGALKTSGQGGHLNGTVMVRNGGELDTNTSSGSSIVNYSSCAVQRAIDYNDRASRIIPITRWSWIDMSAAGAGS